MSKHLTRELLERQAFIVDAPQQVSPRRKVVPDRCFQLPKALYGATVSLYLGFIAVMGIGLQSPGLAIPMAIFALFIIAGFGVPALWTRLRPEHGMKPMTMAELRRGGIMTHTGLCDGKDAVVQVLILPVLIFAWGVAVVTIAASV